MLSLVAISVLWSGCNQVKKQDDARFDEKPDVAQRFKVHWPPRDPSSDEYHEEPALLDGNLRVFETSDDDATSLKLQIVLTRDDTEASRRRWNRDLAFPEYDWMSKVRVWDSEKKWLWPNLPFLLRAEGIKRVERYGGVDPGKGVDNDYAAVLVRAIENSETSRPFVTAEWTNIQNTQGDLDSIVHQAFSKPLSIPIGDKASGQVGVWLTYADFLYAEPPKSWPQEPEDAGGILAWFSINWSQNEAGNVVVKVAHATPPESTGFDWAAWKDAH